LEIRAFAAVSGHSHAVGTLTVHDLMPKFDFPTARSVHARATCRPLKSKKGAVVLALTEFIRFYATRHPTFLAILGIFSHLLALLPEGDKTLKNQSDSVFRRGLFQRFCKAGVASSILVGCSEYSSVYLVPPAMGRTPPLAGTEFT